MICQRWVLHSLGRTRGADLVDWADRAIDLAPAGSPAAVEAAAIRGLGVAATGHVREALDDYLRLADEVGHGAQAQRVAMGRGWLHLSLDDVDQARSALASATPTDFLGGSTRISLWAYAWLARAHFVSGDWDDALDSARQGLDLAGRTGMRLVEPLLWWTAAQVHALRGDWDEADRAVRAGDAGPRDYEIMRVPSCLARAAVAEARADYLGVLRALEPLRQPWAGGGIDEPGAWPWVDVLANALVIEGRLEEADAFLVPHERAARDRGHRSAQARLGYPRGRLLGAQGNLPAARDAFESAAALLEDLPLPYDRARVHFAWGQTLRRGGKRREADHVLQVARDLYAALGASSYVARCDRELRCGRRARDPHRSRRRRADPPGGAGGGAGLPRDDQPRGRDRPLRVAQDGAVPPDAHLREARHPVPRGARGPARAGGRVVRGAARTVVTTTRAGAPPGGPRTAGRGAGVLRCGGAQSSCVPERLVRKVSGAKQRRDEGDAGEHHDVDARPARRRRWPGWRG